MNRLLRLVVLLFCLLLGISPAVQAQAPAWQYAAAFSATANFVNVAATTADAAGNVYVAGGFQGTATWGNISLTSAGRRDIFVAKWSPVTGQFVWVVQAGGIGQDRAYALAVNNTGVYLTGYFSGSANFGSTSLTSAGFSDVFVAKLTDTGSSASFAWAQRAGGADEESAWGLAVNGTSVYVTGFFLSTTTFGSTSLFSAGYNDVFVAKLVDAGSSAAWSWALRAGTAGDELAFSVAVSGTGVYVAGTFDNPTLAFGSTVLTNGGGYDGFVAKLTDAGNSASWTWAQGFGAFSSDMASSVVATGTSVYLGGSFTSSAGFGSTTLVGTGARNGFVAKLTDAGASFSNTWAQRLSGSGGSDGVLGLAVRGASVYAAGTFSSPSLTLGSTVLTNAGGGDVFVTRLVDAGSFSSFAWAQRAGGPGDDGAQTVAVGGTGVFVVGELYGASATFGSTVLANPNAGFGAAAGFVASLTDLALAARSAPASPGLAYPNPTHGPLTVPLPTFPVRLDLVNALGVVVRTVHPTPTPAYTFDLSGLTPDIYTLRLTSPTAPPILQRLTVE
ncbi:T9SS type A sorting domain-containing protein [Hymenobacter rubidus]|uniref:T9SS type A sorting domain-containing protein n=1 Tax=Hymenobacter rubidus TaxID=1441626 RepID=UPI00191DAFEC|nr:T9SS type A sorting domain-containing protein [Hymenobacter rubidus]